MSQAKETQPLFPDADSFIGATLPCGAAVVRAVAPGGPVGGLWYNVTFDRDPVTKRGDRTFRDARSFGSDGRHQTLFKHAALPDLTPAPARQRLTLAGLIERWPVLEELGYHADHPLVGRKLPCGAELIAVAANHANMDYVWALFDRVPARCIIYPWGELQFDRNGQCRQHPDLRLLPQEPDIDTRIADLEAQVAALKAAREAAKVPAELRAAREYTAAVLRKKGAVHTAKYVMAGRFDTSIRLQTFLAGVEWARNTPKTA